MFKEQDGKCFICKQHNKKLMVDHNHQTGEIRKLLCSSCNFTYGLVKEDPFIIQNLLNYALIYRSPGG
jgi:uncharacterized protein YbaR (Trm112 family)